MNPHMKYISAVNKGSYYIKFYTEMPFDFINASVSSCHNLEITLELPVVCPLLLNALCLLSFLPRRVFGYAVPWEGLIETIR